MVRKLNEPRANQRKNASQSQDVRTNIISFRESDIAQRWLLTADGCPTCAQIKKDFKKDFASGKMKATDVGDDKGFEMLTALGIQEAPMFIVELTPEASSRTGVKYIIDE